MRRSRRAGARPNKVIVEFHDGECLAMWPDGQVYALTPEEIVVRVQRRDRVRAEKLGFSVTTIEWRNVPAGFVPPGMTAEQAKEATR